MLVLDDITSRNDLERIKADLVAVIGHELRTPHHRREGCGPHALPPAGPWMTTMRGATLDAVGRNVDRLERARRGPAVRLLRLRRPGRAAPRAGRPRAAAPAADRRPGPPRPCRPSRWWPRSTATKLVHAVRHLVDNALAHSYRRDAARGPTCPRRGRDRGDATRSPASFPGTSPTSSSGSASSTEAQPAPRVAPGWGLDVPRRIVEVRGGRIWCQSRLGHGSRFAFTLPRKHHCGRGRPTPPDFPPIGFAHRGARAHAPENTLEAFTLAVRLAPPGWRATCGSPRTARSCSTTTASSAAGSAGGPSPTCARSALPSHIPALAELYDSRRHRLPAVARREGPAAAAAVVAVAEEAGGLAVPNLYLCTPSFEEAVSWRTLHDDIKLVDSTRIRKIKEGAERRVAAMANAGVDVLNLHLDDWSGGLTTLVHRFGRLAFGWDAQYRRQLDALIATGIDGDLLRSRRPDDGRHRRPARRTKRLKAAHPSTFWAPA